MCSPTPSTRRRPDPDRAARSRGLDRPGRRTHGSAQDQRSLLAGGRGLVDETAHSGLQRPDDRPDLQETPEGEGSDRERGVTLKLPGDGKVRTQGIDLWNSPGYRGLITAW